MVAVAFSLVASFGGLLFCQHFDFSAGVSVALMMGVLLLIVSAVSTFSKNSS
jgi:ABC-type Mn2+/Zn2+ transport system permease subunit